MVNVRRIYGYGLDKPASAGNLPPFSFGRQFLVSGRHAALFESNSWNLFKDCHSLQMNGSNFTHLKRRTQMR